MILLIAGATHTGKTVLAQKLLNKYKYPYLSIDLLKMGLIRSKHTNLTPEDDEQLVAYLWPIVKEMIKTAIENKQNLIVEGCYIPFHWKEDFNEFERIEIKDYFLIMSKTYIEKHFNDIKKYANEVEMRLDDSWYTKEMLIKENIYNYEMCKKYNCNYILINDIYSIDIDVL